MKRNSIFLKLAFLIMLILPLKSKAQDNSISVNLPSLLFGNINANYGHKLNNNWTINVQAQAKIIDFKVPFSLGVANIYQIGISKWRSLFDFGWIDHSQNVLIQPGVRYWMRGAYNRGFFFGGNAIAGIYKFGGDRLIQTYSKGYTFGGAISAGYSYPIATTWNIETEFGIGAIYSKYNEIHPLGKETGFFDGTKSNFYLIPNRISFSVVYLF